MKARSCEEMGKGDFSISQRSGLTNELVTSYDSSLKPGLAKGVLRSYRRMILSEGGGRKVGIKCFLY